MADAEVASPVQLHIYDLSGGMASLYSQALLGTQIHGVWHSGVVVHGKEVYFGQGIKVSPAGATHLGTPHRVVDLGHTEVPWELIEEYIENMAQEFSAESYDLLKHNCNDFANAMSQFLTGTDIPEYVRNVAQIVSNTPFGQMLSTQGFGRQNYGLQ